MIMLTYVGYKRSIIHLEIYPLLTILLKTPL